MKTHQTPVVGIVGGGQLARMSLQAAIPLAIPIRVLAERADDSAALVGADIAIGRADDLQALLAFAQTCDVITFDHEVVPAAHLAALTEAGHVLRPSAATMAFAQDKLIQREACAEAGLPIPPFALLSNRHEAAEFGRAHGFPFVVKAARGGYDGRGVWVVRDAVEAGRIVGELTERGIPPLAEAFIPIERELAVLVARRPDGETRSYPLVETVQVNGMCREIIAPADVSLALAEEAAVIAERLADLSGVVGLLAVELFETGGRLLVNEVATRPHNSGHYTIDGAVTSQFEQHLRAILDWPLGETSLTAPHAVMVNVVGGADGSDPRSRMAEAVAVPGAHIHLYAKQPRPERKIGHVNATGDDLAETLARAHQAVGFLQGDRGKERE